MALIAEGSSRAPHEVAHGRLDVPGGQIHTADLVFDLQAITALSDRRRRATKEAEGG